jgi:bifunctional N-acetylglucosamine-1-phosphate-uridyltransferase/glucosamine-1-phosphate-acetyltransferase GlmU-like protein
VHSSNPGGLRWGLPCLSNDNAQSEYYLTGVGQVLAERGRHAETVRAESIEETLGINDRADLEPAERLKDIARAQSVPELTDASILLGRWRRTSL